MRSVLLKYFHRRLMWVACGLLMTSIVPRATAFNIYNDTAMPVRGKVMEGGFDVVIQPNSIGSCHWSNKGCNPSGSQTALLTVRIETVDGYRDFWCQLRMQAGGWAVIDDDWGLYAQTYDATTGALRDHSAHGIQQAGRDVVFLASADCQYNNSDGQTGGGSATANTVHARLKTLLLSSHRYRGFINAGDLTQNTRPNDEFRWYQDSISGIGHRTYDGLGNHDLALSPDPNWDPFCLFAGCVSKQRLIDDVGHRQHATMKASKSLPHYSWDWHDVHFVQLNLFPGNSEAPGFAGLNPMNSLTFLQNDLAANVGDSRRPVVLVHHYGFDGFSINAWGDPSRPFQSDDFNDGEEWWTESHRTNYWNALTNYNVIAILTGHLHLGSSDNPLRVWTRPTSCVGGPAFIRSFIAGASREGSYLEVEIDARNRLNVRKCDKNGDIQFNDCYAFDAPINVHPSRPEPLAFKTLNKANAAAEHGPMDCRNTRETAHRLVVSTGNYPGPTRINNRVIITAKGGTARIGAP